VTLEAVEDGLMIHPVIDDSEPAVPQEVSQEEPSKAKPRGLRRWLRRE
jgi:hypothetical protein